MHVEHVLALDEGHLEVELAELELPVGAEILVAPARGDLVVAVDPADHAELLEELRRLGEREELARLQPHRHEEVARALGRAARHARRPDVDEAALVHHAADRGDRGVVEPQVALHPLGAHVEPAVAKAQRLVDVLLVELERAAASSARGSAARRPAPRSAPVGRFGLIGSGARATTSPLAWSTNSLRISCAVSAAAGECSGLMTSWTLPVWSRRSTKTSPPWSRRVSAQPATVTRRPASSARSSPHITSRQAI